MINDGNPESRSYAPRTAALPDLAAAAGRGMVKYAQIDESVLKIRALKAPTDGVLARGKGLADLGKGLQSLGKAGMELAREVQKAEGIKAEKDADDRMERLEKKAREARKSKPNPGDWPGVYQDAIETYDRETEKERMPSFAKDIIRKKSAAWKDRMRGEGLMSAAQGRIQQADVAMDDRYHKLLDAGDYPGAALVNSQKTKVGLQRPEEEERRNVQAGDLKKERERKHQLESYLEAVKTYGRKAAEGVLFDSKFGGGKLNADEKNGLRDMGQQYELELMRDDATRFEKALRDGRFSPGGVDTWETENVRLTPEVREKMQTVAKSYNHENVRRIVAWKQDYYTSVFSSEARDYKQSDGPQKWWDIRNKIMLLPEDRAENVLKIINAKDPFIQMEVPLSAPAAEYIESKLETLIREGEWGSFDNGTGKDKAGNPIPSAQLGTSPDEVYKRDEEAWTRALDYKGRLYELWSKEMKKYPGAGAVKGREVLLEVLPEVTRSRLLDDHARAQKAAQKTMETVNSFFGTNWFASGAKASPTDTHPAKHE